MADGGHFQLYGVAHDWVVSRHVTKRLGGIMGEGGGYWFEPNHRIEISDCYVESHWGSNGFIDAGGHCGVGARAGVSDAVPSASNAKTAFIRNAIARSNSN
eukprot:gene34908-23613_t